MGIKNLNLDHNSHLFMQRGGGYAERAVCKWRQLPTNAIDIRRSYYSKAKVERGNNKKKSNPWTLKSNHMVMKGIK